MRQEFSRSAASKSGNDSDRHYRARRLWLGGLGVVSAALLTLLFVVSPSGAQQAPLHLADLDGGIEADPNSDDARARGKYVMQSSGCLHCHTAEPNGSALAGGRLLETEFGNFYTPNITPDVNTGIGSWTLEQFRRAVREGRTPSGSFYYPTFPYTSYAAMTDQDVDDLFAYLQSLEPVEQAAREHELNFPYGWRWLLAPWRWLFFDKEGHVPQVAGNEPYNRGSYLVNALGHCGECHTPRNFLGSMSLSSHMQGNPDLFGGRSVPDITVDGQVGGWTDDEILIFLLYAFYPSGDFPESSMSAVIVEGTSLLTNEDLAAMIYYLRSLGESQPPPLSYYTELLESVGLYR